MGLKLGSDGGVPSEPPPMRRVPVGHVAVVVSGGLPVGRFSVAVPVTEFVATTVLVGPPVVEHRAKALAWSPVSAWPPKPATVVQLPGLVAPLAAGLPEESEGTLPLSLRPLPGVDPSVRKRKLPPPRRVEPDGQVATTLMAEAEVPVIVTPGGAATMTEGSPPPPPEGFTRVLTVAELLVPSGSATVEVTVAVLTTVPGFCGTTVIVRVSEAPEASVPRLQVTVPEVFVQPEDAA